MAIEIRELIIKVRIEENSKQLAFNPIDLNEIRQSIIKECKKEIRREIRKSKER